MKTILDISNHQRGIKLAKLTGVDGYIYRACIGTSKKDDSFLDFIRQNDKPIGLYVASYSKNVAEAEAEADYICDIAKQYCKSKPIIFYDWEYFSATYIKNTFGVTATALLVQSMTSAFCDRCIKNGFKTGVYFNKDFLDRFYTKAYFETHKEYMRWYARPGYATPDYKCDLHQYASNSGAEFGYNDNIDKNILYTEIDETVFVEPMKPISEEPCKLCIGFASSGDIKTIVAQVEGLGIECEVNDGFIYTGLASKGDQCQIMLTCNNLGVPIKEYVAITFPTIESVENPNDTVENSNDLLVKILALLEKIAKFLHII